MLYNEHLTIIDELKAVHVEIHDRALHKQGAFEGSVHATVSMFFF